MKFKTLGWLGLALPGVVQAELVLAPLFQDGAVLQRERPVPVWGRATPETAVAVSFGGQTKSTVTGADGRWELLLDPLEASAEGRVLEVRTRTDGSARVEDVLVGEVWLASGQSNMQWSIAQSQQADQEAAAEGPVPLLRFFQVPRVLSHGRSEQVDAQWEPTTPETVRQFSAVGYFFGRGLAEELEVPVGIIHSSWGGSRIEPWWAEEGLEGIEELAELREHRLARSPGFPAHERPLRRDLGQWREWVDAAERALERGEALPEPPAELPRQELLRLGHNAETGTYQAMIHPLAPYALRGFLWYQGESNNGEGMLYRAKKEALIAGWRQQFRHAEAPFLFVQLAPYHYGPDATERLPGIWQAQQATLAIPHTGMAVTNDIGNLRDIHPGNKSEVGRRLLLWALADTYERELPAKSGPLFAGHEVGERSITIRFDHTGSGLASRDGQPLTWFELAGEDGVFHPASAEILEDGASVRLNSGEVQEPRQARFAWSQVAEPNLMNREGLPAGAFHTHFR